MQTIKVTLCYQLTPETQTALVLAGQPTPIDQEIEIEIPLEEALARSVATVERDGTIAGAGKWQRTLRGVRGAIHELGGGPRMSIDAEDYQADHVLTAGEALAFWRDMPAARERLRAALAAELGPKVEAWEEAERRRAADRAREAEEKEARAAIAAAEATTWIRAYGSERLRKALALGVAVETLAGAYRDERLATELPGFVWDGAATEKESTIINPSMEALIALEEARKISPGAYLCKVRRSGDFDDNPWCEAVRVDDPPWFSTTGIAYKLIPPAPVDAVCDVCPLPSGHTGRHA
jgi:hypothetical protein